MAYQLAQPLIPAWPYLSIGKYHYADLQARPIFFDPERRELGQAWIGSQEAGIYSINSLAYPPHTNFEAPFAFYRFDPAFGRYPNLAIRSVVSPPENSLNPRLNGLQLTDIRMSWTGNTPGYWRYSLTASGNHPMDEQVKIGGTPSRPFPIGICQPGWFRSHGKQLHLLKRRMASRGVKGFMTTA